MKKILLLSNEFGFTQKVIRFAVEAARADGSLLHSIFMQPLHQQEEAGYLFPNDYRLAGKSLTGDTYQQEDQRLIASNLQFFKDECTAAGVPYSVNSQQQTTLKELVEHTWFADLLIMDADGDVGPYALEDLLAGAHCPVCLVPGRAEAVQHVVLCYDGSEHSLHALKLYSYLFPHWSGKPTTLLTVNSNQQAGAGEDYLLGWLHQHFPEAKRELLAGDAQKEIIKQVQAYGDEAFVVLGSYSRGAVSRLLHKSTADNLLQQTHATLFIAHL